MKVINGDLLTIDSKKYIVLETLSYDGKSYAFVNNVTDAEEISEDFYIFEVVGDSVILVKDGELSNILISKFEELLKEDIKNIINE